MRFRGTHSAAQVSGIAGLSGTNAGAVYGPYAIKVNECFKQPYPTPTGTRPPDALIFSDKYAYLRACLNNADWSGVARWYATMIQTGTDNSGYYDPLNPPAPPPPPPAYVAPVYVPPPVISTPAYVPPVAVAPPPVIAPPVRNTGGGGRSGGGAERLKGLGDLAGITPPEYWNLSKLNLQDYCDRTLTLSDLHAFTKECIFKMCVADYGNKVGFGWNPAGKTNLNIAMFLAGLSHSNGQLDWFKSYDNAKNGSRYGFCIGWVKEPSKHTASMIIVAIGAAFMGGAAFSALSAPAGAAAGSGTGAVAGAGTGAAAGAGTGAAIGAGIETVVVVGTAIPTITAGSIAAGLAAGTIAASAVAPAISAASPTIETVVVQAAPVSGVSAGTVAGGVAAGTITAVASAPPIITPEPVIETVTTEASAINSQPVTAGTVGAGVAAGTIVATTAPPINAEVIETVTVEAPADTIQIDPIEAAITGVTTIALTQPVINVPEPQLPEIDTEPSLQDRIVDGIKDAIEDFGSGWVADQLDQYLQDMLGRDPTQDEIDQWQDWIDGGGVGPPPTVNDPNASATAKKIAYWLLAAAIAYAIYESSRKKKRRRASKR